MLDIILTCLQLTALCGFVTLVIRLRQSLDNSHSNTVRICLIGLLFFLVNVLAPLVGLSNIGLGPASTSVIFNSFWSLVLLYAGWRFVIKAHLAFLLSLSIAFLKLIQRFQIREPKARLLVVWVFTFAINWSKNVEVRSMSLAKKDKWRHSNSDFLLLDKEPTRPRWMWLYVSFSSNRTFQLMFINDVNTTFKWKTVRTPPGVANPIDVNVGTRLSLARHMSSLSQETLGRRLGWRSSKSRNMNAVPIG